MAIQTQNMQVPRVMTIKEVMTLRDHHWELARERESLPIHRLDDFFKGRDLDPIVGIDYGKKLLSKLNEGI